MDNTSSDDSGIDNPAFIQIELVSVNLEINEKNDQKIKTDNQDGNVLVIDKQITCRGWIVIFSLGMACFSAFSSYSLVAPFFWRVAQLKGLSFSQYTLVFAVFELSKIVLPPFLSQIALKMTPKYMLMIGLIITAYCSVIFGFLIYARNGFEFFILCLIIRVVWSVGGACTSVTSNLLGKLLFPNHVSTIYASVQIGAVGGLVAGPYFGGILYEKGGYPVPFVTMAVICILSLIPISFLVDNELRVKDQTKKEKPVSVLRAISVPGVLINLIISSMTGLSVGFNESTLDFHLQEIGKFSPSQSGQIFLIIGLVYTVFTLLMSNIADRNHKVYYLVFFGSLLIIFSLIILGPVHGLDLKPSIYYVIASQIFIGTAMAALCVLSFDDFMKQAKIYLPDTDQMIAIVNGLYTSSFAVGVGFGPFIAGRLVEAHGYRKALVPMILAMILLSVLIIVYIKKIRRKSISK